MSRRRSAPFHLLHYDFVVGQHHNAKAVGLPILQSGNQIGKGGIQGGNTFREAEPLGEKAVYYLVGVVLVSLHAHLKYHRSPRQKLVGKVPMQKWADHPSQQQFDNRTCLGYSEMV
jgi:hypothetical protein